MTLDDVKAVAFIHKITVYREDGSLHPLNETYSNYEKKYGLGKCLVTKIYADLGCDIHSEDGFGLSVHATPLLCVDIVCDQE